MAVALSSALRQCARTLSQRYVLCPAFLLLPASPSKQHSFGSSAAEPRGSSLHTAVRAGKPAFDDQPAPRKKEPYKKVSAPVSAKKQASSSGNDGQQRLAKVCLLFACYYFFYLPFGVPWGSLTRV